MVPLPVAAPQPWSVEPQYPPPFPPHGHLSFAGDSRFPQDFGEKTSMSRRISFLVLAVVIGSLPAEVVYGEKGSPEPAGRPLVLKAGSFQHYIDDFNQHDEELYRQLVPNSAAWAFLQENIPFLDCPDKEIEQIYYFRWWTFRKHVKQTPEGFVITEFLPPVAWAGKYNTINCAAGHHLREGRWLGNPKYLDDYSIFWFRKGGNVRNYSFWAADSLWARYLVDGDDRLIKVLLPDLIANYEAWEKQRRDSNGLFWQHDGLDGMEVSIGGDGYRATINSYMYGEALAIAKMADHCGQRAVAEPLPPRSGRDQAAGARETVGRGRPVLQSSTPRRRRQAIRCPRAARLHAVVL